MNILVTGATGFVGKKLVNNLISKGHNVRCPVRESSHTEKPDNKAEIIRGNLLDVSLLSSAVKGVDVVFHLAALRGEKYLPYKYYEEANITLTKKLLEASRNVEKFIFCSTVGIYGYGRNIDENTLPKPSGNYHKSKLLAEELCKAYENTVIVRPAIVYGEDDYDGFLSKIIKLSSKGIFFPIGNGRNKVHMVHINNLAKGLIHMGNNGKTGEGYIIADREALTLREITELIYRNLNKKYLNVKIPAGLLYPPALLYENLCRLFFPGKEPFISTPKINIISLEQSFNISKALSEGYNPEIDVREGISKQIEWMKKKKLIS